MDEHILSTVWWCSSGTEKRNHSAIVAFMEPTKKYHSRVGLLPVKARLEEDPDRSADPMVGALQADPAWVSYSSSKLNPRIVGDWLVPFYG